MNLHKNIIVILSHGQPSANPRLVKEAISLYKKGYTIKVLYCPISQWADEYDIILFKKYPKIKWIRVGYHQGQQQSLFLYARLRQKIYQFVYKYFGNIYNAAIRSSALFSQELTKKAIRYEADLYIGHNLGALPAIIKAARFYESKAAFDFEDFHRGEDLEGTAHWNKVQQVEDKYIPFLTYATTASNLISHQYKELYPFLDISTINNCFSVAYVPENLTQIQGTGLRLFWFSQTIGINRGLESIITALGSLKEYNIELLLLGTLSATTKNYFLKLVSTAGLKDSSIRFHPSVAESEIVSLAANCHIGLACEIPYIPNRDICLTNKIFMYLLAGNAILFSRTAAQSDFWQQHPDIGVVYEQGNSDQIAQLIKNYINNPSVLNSHRTASLQLGKEIMNWETEQKQLFKLLEYHLQ